MNNKEIIKQFVDAAQAKAEESSKEWNDGHINYGYCFGYTLSDFRFILEDLNLSDEQIEILKGRLK